MSFRKHTKFCHEKNMRKKKPKNHPAKSIFSVVIKMMSIPISIHFTDAITHSKLLTKFHMYIYLEHMCVIKLLCNVCMCV